MGETRSGYERSSAFLVIATVETLNKQKSVKTKKFLRGSDFIQFGNGHSWYNIVIM